MESAHKVLVIIGSLFMFLGAFSGYNKHKEHLAEMEAMKQSCIAAKGVLSIDNDNRMICSK